MKTWLGVDENGLGARIGPLLVTGVWAEVDDAGARLLGRKLPKTFRADLDDSKNLVSTHDFALGEAWSRALIERELGGCVESPGELVAKLLLDGDVELRAECPTKSERQCFSKAVPEFSAPQEMLDRIRGHLETLGARGVKIGGARSVLVCTGKLNRLRAEGTSRFSADLHAMERLVLDARERSATPIEATLGKVGGMGKYSRFFGPLAGRLHSVLEEGAAKSSYLFPDLGTLHFVRDADAKAPLVMLSSLVGKYLREVLTARIVAFYNETPEISALEETFAPSGYHDPVTDRFAEATEKPRVRLSIARECFERISVKDEEAKLPSVDKKRGGKKPSNQTSLF